VIKVNRNTFRGPHKIVNYSVTNLLRSCWNRGLCLPYLLKGAPIATGAPDHMEFLGRHFYTLITGYTVHWTADGTLKGSKLMGFLGSSNRSLSVWFHAVG